MRYFPREKAILVLVVPSLILLAFMLLMTTNTITNVSGMVTEGVWVFEDSNCASVCESIDWGTLTPGSAKKYDVYVRNKDVVPIYLIMSTKNWSSSKASYYLTLRWTYAGQRIDPDDVLQLTLTLSVSFSIKDVSSFSFDIVITGSDRLPGDVDGNGVINVIDLIVLRIAVSLGKTVEEYPLCDLTSDGNINVADTLMLKSIVHR